MKRFFTLLLLLLLLSGLKPAQAQTDTEFWFAVPKLTQSHDWANRMFFFRFASSNLPATIIIDMPANPDFVPIVVDLAANAAVTVPIPAVNPGDIFFQMWNENPDQIYNRGIRITATNLITAYFEVGTNNNPDIFSLKGRNALGNDFFVPFQDIHYNQPLAIRPYSAIYIVATEDNTQVTVTPTRPVFPDRPAGVPFVITLQKGQSYAVAPEDYNGVGSLAVNHLGGTRMQANKPIAIATSDDSVRGLPGGCYDLIGDQIIPTSIIGTEYIAMRSRLTIPEGFFVLATQVDTDVFIDGDLIVRLQPGEQHRYEFTQQNHFIETTSPSYVYHVAGFGCEQGGAVLPPINVCTGSTQVSFTRSLGGANGRLFLNILVRAGAQDGFIFNGDGPNTLINASDFQVVPGTTQWLAAELEFSDPGIVPVGQASLIENVKDVFHLGIINGGPSTGVMYGYFSDFNELEVSANISGRGTLTKICFGESVQLIAQGGTHYQWHPPDFLDDPTSPTPISFTETDIKYVVTVSGACNLIDSTSVFIHVADPITAAYTVNEVEGCAPFELHVVNESINVSHYSWRMGDGTVYTTAEQEFYHSYQNTSDTAEVYQFMLVGRNNFFCRDTLITNITVLPEVRAQAEASIISGCTPLTVDFSNLSINAHEFAWDFGDGSFSMIETPMHVFVNPTDTEIIYTVVLIAVSQFGCVDADTLLVHVYPHIEADFQVDPPEHCHPYTAQITNTSFGTDFAHWSFDGGLTFEEIEDQSFPRLFENNTYTDPAVYEIWLISENQYGCADTLVRPITVYPDIKADFNMVTSGCHPLEVSFENNSLGAATYHWDFGDGGNSQEEFQQNRIYTNTDHFQPQSYQVMLVAESQFGCIDTLVKQIVVYPNPKAEYSLDNVIGCAPLYVGFNENSLGAQLFQWNFGDGTAEITTTGSVSHTYFNTGAESVQHITQLIAINDFGCMDTITHNVTIFPQIVAGIGASDNEGCHPLEVGFTNNTLGGAGTFIWHYGDGNTSTTNDALHHHTFENLSHTQQQTYQVSLNVESYYGCKDSTLVTITVNPLPKASFQPAITEGCSPLPVAFYDLSIGAQSWQWNFGDGNTSAQSGNTSHTYYQTYDQEPGVFTAQLQVANTWGCSDTASRQVTVFPDIVADFEPSVFEGNNPLTVSFTNLSEGAHAFFWDFDGAADSSSDENPVTWFHNPSTSDTAVFNVQLVAISQYQCQDEKTVQIQVYPRITDLEASSINGNITPPLSVESMYTVHLFNRGSAVVPGADYTVEIVDAGNNVLATAPGVDVNPNQTVAVLVPFTPTEAGPLAVRGFINLPGDGSPADYYTEVLNLIVTEYYTDIQIIHNAADASVAAVDIYVGDELFLENVAFRTATPFIEVRADIELEFFVAPAGAGIANAVGPVAVTFSKDQKYVVVTNGIVSTTGYDPVKPFTMYPYGNAREQALQATNVDLLVFHGATDAPEVSVFAQGIANQLFAIEYGEFEGYLELPALDYVLEVKDVASGNSLAMFSAPLQTLALAGEAVVVVVSGFLNPANNSNGAAFGLWATTVVGGSLIQLQNVTSVNVVMDGGISMFPNPTSGLVILQSANMMREVKVFDLSGRAVYATTLETNEYQINAHAFNNGIYFVQVITSEGIFVNKLRVQQ